VTGGANLTAADGGTQPVSAFEAARAVERLRGRRFLALGLMAVATLWSGIVVGVMVATYLAERAVTPPDPTTGLRRSPETDTLRSLHERLRQASGEAADAIKETIREEDQRVRTRFHTYRRRLYWGAWLLLVGLAGLVASARWYASLDPTKPMPKPLAERPDADAWLAARRRKLVAVGVVAGLVVLGLVVMGLTGGRSVPSPGGPSEPSEPALPVVDRAGFQDDWPRFRGPTGMGVVKEGDWPAEWDAASGKNLLWKTPVPARGKGSPVVWGNRIFLTGGSREKLVVMGFERKTGKLLWETPIESPLLAKKPAGGEGGLKVPEDTGYAAATPATDGHRVYVVFATADMAALDFDGKLLWQRPLGKPDNMYGMATSLVVHKDTVILQHDQGGDAEDKLSALLAFDGTTGKERWRTPRPVPNSWATPIIANTGSRAELLTSASPWLIGYDPDTGKELWRAEGVKGDVAPSPVFAGGLIMATSQYSRLVAIRAGGSGDVTQTHTAWEAEEGLSDAPSPTSDGKLLLQVNSGGRVTCYDVAKTKPPAEGAKWPSPALLWDQELDTEVWSSPSLVGKLVYLVDKKGKTFLFPLAEKYELKGTNALGEEVFASPAFGDGQIYHRTDKHLVCIGKKQP
jgi:outer membrane protein assembly factor BamB